MPYLKYQGRDVFAREGENVLDAFLRHGISIPFSCRNGVCHVCLQRCISGSVPPVAQNGLRPELRDQGYFLPCKCVPYEEMDIAPPGNLYTTTFVHSKEMLSPNVCKLLLEPVANLRYRAGQFVNLRRQDGLTRSYSLASLPERDYFLEIHVQRKEGGAMSNWILDELKPGDALDIQGADGECYYKDAARGQPLLLIGTGTGLAPLYGILCDALQQGHAQEIHLYHGGRSSDRFYLRDRLHALAKQHSNFHYHECISGTGVLPPGIVAGRAHEVAFAQHKDLRGWHVFLAGLAEMVDRGEQLAAERGARPEAIHADAFVFRDLRNTPRGPKKTPAAPTEGRETRDYPPPDPELWKALRSGDLLMEVLQDFYSRVFKDEKLSSFFLGVVTIQRAIEKQYLFSRQVLTGEKIYFGDRPRNAHHWMVISEDLFDYREELMATCLREHGLPEPMVRRFREMEEFFRRDIVKSAAIPRTIGDIELPLDGFDELIMDVGTLCDSCGNEVAVGEKVIYHVRLGKIYCADCSAPHTHEVPQA
jgi:ferredoxin-NADP reductase/ferredoxin/truncated hemoglobin YjbI